MWWPTWKGWLLLLFVIATPLGAWAWLGEPFLARTERLPADTLVIESWIQADGLHAAAAEYLSGNYRHLVITGGLTGSHGTKRRRSYAAIAEKELVDAGIAHDLIIVAPVPDVENQRTHAMAVAAQRTLEARRIHPVALNVFTAGTHARRSQLVYSHVFSPATKVGVISWTPEERSAAMPWWKSSERTLDLMKETLGYTYELLFNSGRKS
jgi:hypothetical protein